MMPGKKTQHEILMNMDLNLRNIKNDIFDIERNIRNIKADIIEIKKYIAEKQIEEVKLKKGENIAEKNNGWFAS